jgi:4'-phosphopantetheinyl transferase
MARTVAVSSFRSQGFVNWRGRAFPPTLSTGNQPKKEAFMLQENMLWLLAPSDRKLAGDNVHVWAASLALSLESICSYDKTLSPDERKRAVRFHFERDRNRFIAGRGILREILGGYLGLPPSQLRFDYGQQGKPVLANLPAQRPLHFNVAHSDDLILIAAARTCLVGIDVELVRPVPEFQDIVGKNFSTQAAAKIMATPRERQLAAFYQLWTRNEACLKATGEGLSDAKWTGEPSQRRPVQENIQMTEAWTVVELNPAQGYAAALAATAAGLTISCWRWTG